MILGATYLSTFQDMVLKKKKMFHEEYYTSLKKTKKSVQNHCHLKYQVLVFDQHFCKWPIPKKSKQNQNTHTYYLSDNQVPIYM